MKTTQKKYYNESGQWRVKPEHKSISLKHMKGNQAIRFVHYYDTPNQNLRLYCIRMGNTVVILGGGGPKSTRTLQQDPKLKKENYLLREVSETIKQKMISNEIRFSDNELELIGEIINHE